MVSAYDNGLLVKHAKLRKCPSILARISCCLLLVIPLLLGSWMLYNREGVSEPPVLSQPKIERTLPGFSGSIAFSPDSNSLLMEGGGNAFDPAVIFHLPPLHDPRPPDVRWMSGYMAYIRMAWSPNGKWLAYAWGCAMHEEPYPEMLMLLDSRNGKVLHYLIGQGRGLLGNVIFSPDSRLLASGSENHTVCLWDVATGKLVHKLSGHNDNVHDLAFSPDGRQLASIDGEFVIRLWDTASGKLLSIITQNHIGPGVGCLAFHPKNGYLLAATDKDRETKHLATITVNLWDLSSPSKAFKAATFVNHTNTIHSLAFHKDGRYLASGGFDGRVCLWDICKKELAYTLENGGEIGKVTFSPDGQRLAVAAGAGHFAVTTIWHLHPEDGDATPR